MPSFPILRRSLLASRARLTQLADGWIHFLRKQLQALARVFRGHEAGLHHHHEMAHLAAFVQVSDLLDDSVGVAPNGDADVVQLLPDGFLPCTGERWPRGAGSLAG